MKIDVTIATKNNEEIIGRCIENIKKYIPYNRIILVDDSEDSTPEIAERIGAEVIHFSAKLGLKRVKQAEVSNTEWIASIDSDVFVRPNWWKTMSRYIADDIGIIGSCLEGSIKEVIPSYDAFTKWNSIEKFRKSKITSTMGNNLIRRNLLLSCKEKLVNVHGGEDAIIGRHIVDNGYKCAANMEINGFHHHSDPIAHCKMAYFRGGQSIVFRAGKLIGLRSVFTTFFDQLISWIRYSLHSKKFDFRLYGFLLSLYFEMIRGVADKIKRT